MYYIVFILIICFSLTGCSSVKSISSFKEIKFKEYATYVQKPYDKPLLGEKLVYKVYWIGIPAGEITLNVKEVKKFDNFDVFHVIAKARSNKVFSLIYKTDDTFHSYIDKEELFSRSYKLVREGKVKSQETVYYDYDNLKAEIASTQESKIIDIPGKIHDASSCLYYLRTQDIKLKDKVIMDVNVDDKNWKLECNVEKFGRLSLIGLGTFNTFLVKPRIKRNGKYRKDRDMKIWFTADQKRIPILINIDVPLGYMKVVLSRIQQ